MSYSHPGATNVLHQSESGIRESRLEIGATACAKELARYIKCPSTIRVRVLDRYGFAPSIDEIRTIQASVFNDRDRYRKVWETLAEKQGDDQEFRVTSLVKPIGGKKPQRISQPVNPETDDPIVFENRVLTPVEIVAAVADHFKVTVSDITGPSRLRAVCNARFTICYILRKRGNSFSNIARRIGRSDHKTIINAVYKFERNACSKMRKIAERYIGGGE